MSGLINNTVPLAGIRNDLGKLFTPYMREINSGVFQSIRNRNLITENLAENQLPLKYDMLNGRPLKDWDFLTRAFNAVSPVTLNLEQSDGRNFLFDSGYDLRTSTYFAPDSTNLTDHPYIRSEFQRALGSLNLELELDKFANDPKMIASMEKMYADIRAGKRAQFNARDYYHNVVIDRLFRKARRIAWAQVRNLPEAQDLIKAQRELDIAQRKKKRNTANILNITK